LPDDLVGEVVGDYEAHFAEGEARGRSEVELVAALGDPARLARELSAEICVRRWQEKPSPSAATGAALAFLGLGAADLLVVLPLALVLAGLLVAFFATAVGVFCSGALLLVTPVLADVLPEPLGEQLAALSAAAGNSALALLGLSLMSGSVAVGAALMLLAIGITNATIWYGRLHYHFVRPPAHGGVQKRHIKLSVIDT